MVDVNTSIYHNNLAPTKALDPLSAFSTVTGITNAQNQNQLFQQKFAADKAIGDAYQQSTDPATGVTDYAKLNSLVAGNPAAAFKAGEVATQSRQGQASQLDIDTKQLDLAVKHVSQVNQSLGALIAKPDLSINDVVASAVKGVQDKRWSAQHVTGVISELAGLPQDQLRERLKQMAVQNLSSLDQLNVTQGTPQVVDLGGQKVVMQVPTVGGGAPTVRAVMGNTLSPGEQVAERKVWDPKLRQFVTMTNQQYLDSQGIPAPGTVTPQPAAGAPVPRADPNAPPGSPASAFTADPNAPGAALAPVNPAAGPSPLGSGRINGSAQPGRPALGLPAGPPMGSEGAANVTGEANARQGVTLTGRADVVPQTKALLGTMEGLVSSGDFKPGPGAESWREVKSGLNRALGADVFDGKSIASQEEFSKLAVQLAQAQFQALGGTGTDAKLDSASHTSPNTMLSTMGNKGIIALLKGNEDAIATKNREWQAHLAAGNGPETYGQFSTQFNKTYDPRVFQSAYLDDTSKQTMLKGMTAAEQKQFRSAYNMAVTRGWIPDPRAGNGG